ncbi:MAG TPA: murein biosynthesis integral membrane protein MurJ [Candidatus Obscuribacterales bacterium]
MTAEPGQREHVEKKRSLGRVFGLVAILTVLSKFAGLARDMVVASSFGLSRALDAYNLAYQLTGNVLILFGGLGGPFHSSTVAVLTPRKDTPDAGKLMAQIAALTVVILSVIMAAVYFLAPYLVSLIFPSTNLDPQLRAQLFADAVGQLHVMAPLIAIAGIVGLSYGVLNVYDKVFWPSLSPAIASIAIIVAVIFFRDDAGLCLAVGTLAGAIGQALVQIPGMLRSPIKWSFNFEPHPGLKEYASMLWPATISTSVGQLNTFIDSIFISQIPSVTGGHLSAIVNTNRLVQLPLGVLLTAMLVPILPRFTEQVAANKVEDLKKELARALRFLWFLGLPITALLLTIPRPIVELLFQRGRFTAEDTTMMVQALLFMAPSIIFYLARDLITRVFYAHQDSKTPYYVALVAIGVHLFLDWALVGPMGISGIALALTLVTVFNLTCLAFLLKRKIGNLGLTQVIVPLIVMIAASAACGASAMFIQSWLETTMHSTITIARALELGLSIFVASGVGLLLYAGLCLSFRLDEPMMVFNRLTRRKA